MKELEQIKARLTGATPGPWRWDEKFGDKGDTGLALTNEAGHTMTVCSECVGVTDDDNPGKIYYPCPTVTAIKNALKESQ